MPSRIHLWLAVLAAVSIPTLGAEAQSKPDSRPDPSTSAPAGKAPGKKAPGKKAPGKKAPAPRIGDRARAKYVRRQLPMEQRRVKIPGSQAAVHSGLVWLKKHQSADGRWDADGFMKMDVAGAPCDGAGNAVHDIGVTGLALLAFLGEGNTQKHGAFQAQVQKGVEWLLRQQRRADGLIGVTASHDFIYDHAVATCALIEVYGLSRDEVLKKPAQHAIHYLEAHRNPYSVWRYQPRDNDNDMSVTSWCILAYRSAQDFELNVNERALKVAATWIDEMTDPTTGRVGYARRGGLSSRHPGDHGSRYPPQRCEAMTAAGLFCQLALGRNPAAGGIAMQQADLLLSKAPRHRGDGSIDHYYWYYASHAMFQVGGKHWTKWYIALSDAVVKSQRKDGNFLGSWDPSGAWGEDGGRVYSTAMCVLALQSEYRFGKLAR